MCGIAGFFDLRGEPASRDDVAAMLARLRHRGPDDEGIWSEGNVALGHRRLSILDPTPAAHQPLVTEDGDGILVQSGEIYNYLELRTELEAEGVRFRSRSDGEVVLHALHRWGVAEAVPRLDGMFALAYLDRRVRALWLIRDRAGIVPLYVARKPGAFVFASEIKGLLAHPQVPARPDLLAVAALAYHERLDGAWTPFDGVEAVLPGTILRISAEKSVESRYFDLLRDLDVNRLVENPGSSPAGRSLEEAAKQLEDRLFRSVEIHLRSDVPLAAMCSGGIDSSLVTAMASEQKRDLVGYVADVEGVGGREHERATKVCRHLGVELRRVPVRYEDCLRLWPLAVSHNDAPLYFANDIPYLMVAQAARRDGFKVLLSGEGADELFGGYSWQAGTYRTWQRRRWHARFWPDIAPLRAVGKVASRLAPLDLAALSREPFRWIADEAARLQELRGNFLFDGGERYVRRDTLFRRLAAVRALEERAFLTRAYDDFHLHLGTLLPSRNKMAFAASVEVRVPYLESELIDFGLHLPPRFKFDGRRGKRLSRMLVKKRLPPEIAQAPKIGFELPQAMWRNAGAILEGGMMSDLFRWGPRQVEPLREHLGRDPQFLFVLVGLELWARLYFGGASPEELGESLARASLSAGGPGGAVVPTPDTRPANRPSGP